MQHAEVKKISVCLTEGNEQLGAIQRERKDSVYIEFVFGVLFCNKRENADISRDVFCVVNLVGNSCVFANVVCKRVSWLWTGIRPKHVETEVNNKHLIVASCWPSLFILYNWVTQSI